MTVSTIQRDSGRREPMGSCRVCRNSVRSGELGADQRQNVSIQSEFFALDNHRLSSALLSPIGQKKNIFSKKIFQMTY